MNKIKYRTKKKLWDAVFIGPALILFSFFTYYPLLVNLLYSLTSWNGLSSQKTFVGVDNFVAVLQDKSIVQATINTVYMAVLLVVIGTLLRLSLALIVHSRIFGQGLIKVILYIPSVLSPIVLSYTWLQFLQYTGYINQFLEAIHLSGLEQSWLLNADFAKVWVCIVSTLQWTGYGMLFFLTGLNSIPQDIYEAAKLDGAKGGKLFLNVTLPLIMPSFTVSLFLLISGALELYALPLSLTGGGPNGATTTITMSIYTQAFGFNRFGYASAQSLLFFALIAIITCIQLGITRRREIEY